MVRVHAGRRGARRRRRGRAGLRPRVGDGADPPPDGVTCPVCGASVGEHGPAVACGLCATPHHLLCFEYTGRCSVYGCGGITTGPLSATPAARLPLYLDEATPLPGALAPWLGRLPRLAGWYGRQLGRPLLASLGGAALAAASYPLMWALLHPASAYHWGRVLRTLREVGPILVGCGALHALLSPLLTPLQHRYPGEVTRWSLLVAWTAFTLGRLWEPPQGPSFLVYAALTAAAGMVFSSSLGEWLLGRFSRAGRALGAAGPVARGLVTALAFVAAMAVPCVLTGIWQRGAWREVLVFSLMAAVSGAPAFEVSREEYRKRLVAATERPQAP